MQPARSSCLVGCAARRLGNFMGMRRHVHARSFMINLTNLDEEILGICLDTVSKRGLVPLSFCWAETALPNYQLEPMLVSEARVKIKIFSLLHRPGSTSVSAQLRIFARVVADFYRRIWSIYSSQSAGVFLGRFLRIYLLDPEGFDPARDVAGRLIGRLQLLESDFFPSAFVLLHSVFVDRRQMDFTVEEVLDPARRRRWWMSPTRWMRWLPILIDGIIWFMVLSFLLVLAIRLIARALSISIRTFLVGGAAFGVACVYLSRTAVPGAQPA